MYIGIYADDCEFGFCSSEPQFAEWLYDILMIQAEMRYHEHATCELPTFYILLSHFRSLGMAFQYSIWVWILERGIHKGLKCRERKMKAMELDIYTSCFAGRKSQGEHNFEA